MLYLAGISISFFLSLILLSKKNKSLADKILGAWLVVIGIHLWFFYANISGFIFDMPWVLGIHLPIPLLHGPFLYLYSAALTGNLRKFNGKALLHFLPAALDYLYLIHFFTLSSEEKISVYKNHGQGQELYLLINYICISISGIGYVIATSVLLHRHRKNIVHEFSATEKINLDWIQYLIYGIAIIWLLVLFGNDDLIFGTSVAFIIFIGYFGIKQVKIFSSTINEDPKISEPHVLNPDETSKNLVEALASEEKETESAETEIQKQKYSKSGLSEEMTQNIHEKLKALMRNEKTYTESELTLIELAKKLGVHPNHVSQVINKMEGKNFYDYINTLRVEEVKTRLKEPGSQKFTLLSIAFESGFNSKSTFNKYFRKVTGIPPSDYTKQIQDTKNQSGSRF